MVKMYFVFAFIQVLLAASSSGTSTKMPNPNQKDTDDKSSNTDDVCQFFISTGFLPEDGPMLWSGQTNSPCCPSQKDEPMIIPEQTHTTNRKSADTNDEESQEENKDSSGSQQVEGVVELTPEQKLEISLNEFWNEIYSDQE